MKKEVLMKEIESIIDDALSTSLEYVPTSIVPNVNDTQLTFGFGGDKKGKIIKTCVLYVDIRNSVELVRKHQFNTMGKIYTVFTTIVLKIAKEHNANVRNIIGDRVMLVFPEKNCCENAVEAAISINQAASILNKKYETVEFKCGIGIDYGEMRVLKVGIKVPGTENYDNKNLVWVGYPANHASRLTDVANKKIETKQVYVKLKKFNYAKLFPSLRKIQGLSSMPQDDYIEEEKVLEEEEFLSKLSIGKEGQMRFEFSDVIEYEYMTKKESLKPILMTESVYKGFSTAQPNRASIKKGLWKITNHQFPEITGDVYEGDLVWIIN